MKFLVSALMILFALNTFADQAPIEMRLKKLGYTECTSTAVFNPKFDCGQPYAEIFSCAKKDVSQVNVLAMGAVRSDVGDGTCNPVRVIDYFVEQSN